jgi:O-antigen/teichoic acid export membrane protein
MQHQTRTNIAIGLVLILLGAWFLAVQFVPGLQHYLQLSWPLTIVGIGLLLLVLAILIGAPGMAVPACVVGGIGGLLYWQNQTGKWDSWAYIWTLIPGFVGVGVILSGLLGGEGREALNSGGRLILISLVMFLIFGSFFGVLGMVGPYWPVLLIILGVLLFFQSLIGRRR